MFVLCLCFTIHFLFLTTHSIHFFLLVFFNHIINLTQLSHIYSISFFFKVYVPLQKKFYKINPNSDLGSCFQTLFLHSAAAFKSVQILSKFWGDEVQEVLEDTLNHDERLAVEDHDEDFEQH